jgi:hypothetical protein
MPSQSSQATNRGRMSPRVVRTSDLVIHSRPPSVNARLAHRLGCSEATAHQVRYRAARQFRAVLESLVEAGELVAAVALYAEAGVPLVAEVPPLHAAEQDHDYADADEDREQSTWRVVRRQAPERAREAAKPYARKLALEVHHGRIHHAALCRDYEIGA